MGRKHVSDCPAAKIEILDYQFRTHKRHYLQQTQYAICLQQFGVTQGFGKYEDAITSSEKCKAFQVKGEPFRQDVLIKYTIPVTERKKVLRELGKMNISDASLFGTEDALIKTLALRELELWK